MEISAINSRVTYSC